MFRPSRLLTFALLAFLVYMGFFAVPGNAPGVDAFDPEAVAEHEASAWQAALVREEFSSMVSCILYQRELHRLSWFRAIESGMALARAMGQFVLMTDRYHRVIPELESVATIERTWKASEFDAAAVGRRHGLWLATLRDRRQASNSEHAVSEMAEELGLRFGIPSAYTLPVASDRTEAYRHFLAQGASPDWDHVRLLLTRAYTTLQTTLVRAADASATAR